MGSNPLGEIYNSWLNQNQQMPILISSGKIDIICCQASSDQIIGSDDVDCSDGRVISVP
jgi:hypothetical protein